MPPENPAENPVEKLLAFADEIQSFIRRPPMAGAQASAPPECFDAARVVMFHWGRTVKTSRAVALLVRAGLSDDAMVLLRTLVEVFIEVAFLAKRPQDAKLYLKYGINTELKWWKRLGRVAPDQFRRVAKVQQAVLAWELEDGQDADFDCTIKSAWHPEFPSVNKRAKEAGVPKWMYEMVYNLGSRYVHGSGDWMRELARPRPTSAGRVSYGGDVAEAALPLMLSCWVVVDLLRLMNGLLHLELDPALTELEDRFNAVSQDEWPRMMAKYKDLSG